MGYFDKLRSYPHVLGVILMALLMVVVWIVYLLWASKNG
jgi:nitrogen fixation-related uncharacterized protein